MPDGDKPKTNSPKWAVMGGIALNVEYTRKYGFEATAAARVTAKMVAVPPPIAFQEAVFKSLSFPVSGTFRFTLFDTADFNTRVYAFEQDLFAALSVPAFSGRGTRMFLNLSWRVNTWLRLEGRYTTAIQLTN